MQQGCMKRAILAAFLTDLSNSVFDASAEYQLYRLSLGLLQWDLYRDNDRFKFADQKYFVCIFAESVCATGNFVSAFIRNTSTFGKGSVSICHRRSAD